MTLFLLVLALMLIGVGGMAIGVMFGRKPISGSCGGLANSGVAGGGPCEVCGGDPNRCETGQGDEPANRDTGGGKTEFYNADR